MRLMKSTTYNEKYGGADGARNGDPLYSAEVSGSNSLWNQAPSIFGLPLISIDLQKTWKKTWKLSGGISV